MLSALPVVAVSAQSRHAAIVCLSPRLQPIRVEQRSLRYQRTRGAKTLLVEQLVQSVVSNTAAPTLVLESDVRRDARVTLTRSGLADWAEDRGLRLVELSCRDASLRISGDPRLATAFARLRERYHALDGAPSDAKPRGVRSPTLLTTNRPLVAAFVLAHAFALGTVVSSFTAGAARNSRHL